MYARSVLYYSMHGHGDDNIQGCSVDDAEMVLTTNNDARLMMLI